MLSVVYSSSASHQFSLEDLRALLEQSRATNTRNDLTGLLVYREGRFLQLLEGPDDAVRERMAVIEADNRHGQIRVLLEDEIEDWQFPRWTMGYADVGDLDMSTPGYRRTFHDIDANDSAAGSLPALRALIAWFRIEHNT